MHCRVAHCRRVICDQGEFRGALLGIIGEALLVFFADGKADWTWFFFDKLLLLRGLILV